jgi:hypothetical protein
MRAARKRVTGLFDAAVIDTTPTSEERGLFTPPPIFTGDNKAYHEWFLRQHRECPSVRQQFHFHVTFFERNRDAMTFKGPHAEVVQAMLKSAVAKRLAGWAQAHSDKRAAASA